MLRIATALLFSCLILTEAYAQDGKDEPGKNTAEEKTTSPAAEAKKAREEPFVMLPKPFDDVMGNVKELEKTGLFKIVEAKIDFIDDTQDQGISWTLEVQRRVTARRAILLLQNLRDARFYHLRKQTKSKLPIFNTVLEYPGILDQAASEGKSLLQRERFRVWVPLTDTETRRIVGQDANLFQLGRPKRKPRR